MNEASNIAFIGVELGYHKPGNNFSVLNQLNLNFNAGDFIGVVGLNGSGKSTLLKSACGLLPVLSGQVLLNGISITDLPLNSIAKKISIVLTEKIGGFNLTVFDAVASGQMPFTDAFHRLRPEHLQIIEKSIAACGLKGLETKLIHELSDGLFQKTMIAKTLAQQTPSILLDEPSAYLDYASKHELFLLLKNLAETENKCVLVSSHDLDLVLKYCKRLLVVSNNTAELIMVNEASGHAGFLGIGRGFI